MEDVVRGFARDLRRREEMGREGGRKREEGEEEEKMV